MWPLVAATVISAGVTLYANYEASKTAKSASNDALAAQKANIDRIMALAEKMKLPSFDGRELSKADIEGLITFIPNLPTLILEEAPEAVPLIASQAPLLMEHITEASPSVAKFIAENPPKVITADGEDAQLGLQAQRNALEALRRTGTEGDTISRNEMIMARESIAKGEAGQRGAMTEEFARRGQLGGGQELLMKLAGQQASQQQAGELAMGSANDAIRRRLEALTQSANIGRDLYSQDVSKEVKNADIINAFNQRNTTEARRIEAQRVADMNAREAREASAKRDIQGYNVSTQNRIQEGDTAYERTQANVDWQAQEDTKRRNIEAQRQNDINRTNIENTAEAEIRGNRINMTLGERQRQDDIDQQKYQNELGLLNVKAGQAGMANKAIGDAATAKTNEAYAQAGAWGDVAKAGTSAVGQYYAGVEAEEDREWKRKMLEQYGTGALK